MNEQLQELSFRLDKDLKYQIQYFYINLYGVKSSEANSEIFYGIKVPITNLRQSLAHT